jgi:TonB family protein
MNVSKIRRCVAVGAFLIANAAAVMGAEPSADFVPFGTATEKWNRGQHDEAMRDFMGLAQAGDTRSQLLLGLSLLEGKDLPKDVPQGFAWLQIAASDYVYSFGRTAVDIARKQKAIIEPQLSGADLIHADRIASEYLESASKDLERRKAIASSVLTGRTNDPGLVVVPGCALDRSMAVCAAARKYRDWSHACTGDLPTPDVEATWTGPNAFVTRPSYPPDALRKVWEGVVVFQIHVDRSGYPCRIALLRGSGQTAIDNAVLEAVRGWRLQPATKGGRPVEALNVGRVEYLITDYALGKEYDYQRAGKILSQ